MQQNFERSFESIIQEDTGEISGRVFAFDEETFADGMKEVIPKNCKVNFSDNLMLLLSHRKDKMLGRKGANLELLKRDDGIYFKCKKVGTEIYKEALNLVKNKIVGGVSPGFSAQPKYENGKRTFSEIQINEISLCGNPAYESSFVHAREKDNKKKTYLPPECF